MLLEILTVFKHTAVTKRQLHIEAWMSPDLLKEPKVAMGFKEVIEPPSASGISLQMGIPAKQCKWAYPSLLPAAGWENGSASAVALEQISYWNSEVTNLCITSVAPDKLQTLPKRQLCKTWEMVQMCVSLGVKICDVLSTARIDQMDQALQSSH